MRVAFCSRCGTRLGGPPPTSCAGCGAEVFADARPCAGALVEDAGRLLLVLRAREPWRQAWDVPGGHCLAGEHPADTAVRETLEETGFPVRVTSLFGIWLQPGEAGDPTDAGTLNVYYLAVPCGAPARPPDPRETVEIGWFPAGGLPAGLAFPEHLPSVLAAWQAARG